MKLIIAFATYPRDGNTTYKLLERTLSSLLENQNLSHIDIKFLIIGDDYSNIDELKPLFMSYDHKFYNININDALRNKNIPFNVKWCQACQRSIIFMLEKSLELEYDYILISADDDLYLNKKIETSIKYIKEYNEPDLIFSLGIHVNSKIIPNNKEIFSYPSPGQCIAGGIFYKLKNLDFIKCMLEYRKKRWNILEQIIKENKSFEIIMPEDAELWIYLSDFFLKKIFTSILIPIVTINHDTQKTLKKYCNN